MAIFNKFVMSSEEATPQEGKKREPTMDEIESMTRAQFSAKMLVLHDEMIKPYKMLIAHLSKQLESKGGNRKQRRAAERTAKKSKSQSPDN